MWYLRIGTKKLLVCAFGGFLCVGRSLSRVSFSVLDIRGAMKCDLFRNNCTNDCRYS